MLPTYMLYFVNSTEKKRRLKHLFNLLNLKDTLQPIAAKVELFMQATGSFILVRLHP